MDRVIAVSPQASPPKRRQDISKVRLSGNVEGRPFTVAEILG
jgi:hypothetical protein